MAYQLGPLNITGSALSLFTASLYIKGNAPYNSYITFVPSTNNITNLHASGLRISTTSSLLLTTNSTGSFTANGLTLKSTIGSGITQALTTINSAGAINILAGTDSNGNVQSTIRISHGNTNVSIGSGSNDTSGLYNDRGYKLDIVSNGTSGSFNANDLLIVSQSSVAITTVLNLTQQHPLPAGNIGDIAVSASHLWFYNGAWSQLD